VKPERLLLVLAVASSVAAPAQTPGNVDQEFSADRPGFATPPTVLRRGVLQVEGGVTFSEDFDQDVRQRNVILGNPLIRAGVGRSVELRVSGDGFRRTRTGGGENHSTASGWSDVTLGAKIAVAHEGRILPAISLLPSISVPAGNSAFTSSTYDPSLAIAWLKTLPAGLSLGGTFAGARISDGPARRAQYSSAVSVGIPAPAGLAAYAEIYAVSSGEPGKAATWTSDAGVSHMFGANLQLDIEAGRQISRGAPCWFAAAGFAVRATSLSGRRR
jgi:hypothetical protein